MRTFSWHLIQVLCRIYLTIFLIKPKSFKTMDLRRIGSQVRARRSELGLSQDRLAKLGGLSRATINQLEMGTLKDLGVAKLAVVMELVGLHLSASQRATCPAINRPKLSTVYQCADVGLVGIHFSHAGSAALTLTSRRPFQTSRSVRWGFRKA